MKRLIKGIIHRAGFDVIRYQPAQAAVDQATADLSDQQKAIIAAARPFTMTTVERMISLINATTYIVKTGIEGDVVECGVWRGGSMMVIAATLRALNDTSRTLTLYDTYEGMSAPTDADRSHGGVSAESQMQADPKGRVWCIADLDDVRANVLSTGYPADKIRFVKGKVEDTIPAEMPGRLALLRLDTDWYESTRHELHHLYPLLNRDGVLVIDDYGHWQGARKAVDEYFEGQRVFLHRIDYTGRLLVKGAT